MTSNKPLPLSSHSLQADKGLLQGGELQRESIFLTCATLNHYVLRKPDIRKFHAYEAKYKYLPHTDLDKMEPDSWYSSASKNSASSSSSLLEYDVNGTRLPRVGVTL